jgi:hypothetical protein
VRGQILLRASGGGSGASFNLSLLCGDELPMYPSTTEAKLVTLFFFSPK